MILLAYYCPEVNEIVLWRRWPHPFKKFKAEHIKTGKKVSMILLGDL